MSDVLNYDYPQDATPQAIWAILQEIAKEQRETAKIQSRAAEEQAKEKFRREEQRLQLEEERRQREKERLQWQEEERLQREEERRQREEEKQQWQEESQRWLESRKQLEETKRIVAETSRQMKLTDKKFGDLYNRFGELAEHLVAPNIREKFNALGFSFGEVSKNKEIVDAQGNSVAEIDILLENSDSIMVVEVKATPKQKDVDTHLKRMEILRRRADIKQDKRALLGAIAGAIMTKAVRDYILANGFFAIEQTGDTVAINAPKGSPRRW